MSGVHLITFVCDVSTKAYKKILVTSLSYCLLRWVYSLSKKGDNY